MIGLQMARFTSPLIRCWVSLGAFADSEMFVERFR